MSRALRIATLVVPPVVVTLCVERDHLLDAAAPALAVLWVVMAGALMMRYVEARRPAPTVSSIDRPSAWAQVDVLTATGASIVWMGAAALVAAAFTGWASLSVVGVLGLGAVYLAVIWTALVAGGDQPWRRATVTRSILPEVAVEGDPLREEVRTSGVKIPAGMRLFAVGRVTRHGAVTRYSVGSEGSHADLKLESELGPAPRGEHRVPPLALWLGDVLGLTRTPVVHRGEAMFSALPRPGLVDGVRELLGNGGDDASSRPTHRLPTEGTFRIREYVPGDDTRRIHWVRSLQTNQLVVRLPDEIPPAEPVVRLILDNDLAGTESLSCRAPGELLDALVRVWLGIGKALGEAGTRVTLVTAVDKGGAFAAVERNLIARSSREGLRLGARAVWQSAVPLATLLARNASRQVVVSSRPRRVDSSSEILWVVVPEAAWTSPEPRLPTSSPLTLAFPTGSADNRLDRRMGEQRRIKLMWQDRMVFRQLMSWTDRAAFSGAYVARPSQGRIALAVIP